MVIKPRRSSLEQGQKDLVQEEVALVAVATMMEESKDLDS